jgi:hypothetical protein
VGNVSFAIKKVTHLVTTIIGGKRMQKMYTEKYVRLIAGTFILVSLALGLFVSKYWFIFTAFVGVNLVQSVFSNWCLMEDILRKLGVKDKAECSKEKEGD